MAVVDYYVDTMYSGSPRKLAQTIRAQGANRTFALLTSFTLAAGDSDGSVYRVFQAISSELIIHQLIIANDAMAGFTAANVGLYKTASSAAAAGGAVISAALFASALDFSAAHNSLLPSVGLNALAAIVPQTPSTINGVAIGKANQRLFELAGQTVQAGTRQEAYDLAITATTRGAAGGNMAVWALVSQG